MHCARAKALLNRRGLPYQEIDGTVIPGFRSHLGARRSLVVATPGYHDGRAPRNKGLIYPADPPTSSRSSPWYELPVTGQTVHASGR